MGHFKIGVVAILLTTLTGACAKSSDSPAQTQQNSLTMLTQALQIAVPDGSYTVQSQSAVPASGTNVQSLETNIVDKVAVGIKEMNFHLAQTIAQGTNTNNSLSIVDSGLATSLQGVVDTTQNVTDYTYTLNSANYFTGTVQASGAGGNLSFPVSTFSAAFSVTYTMQSSPDGSLVINVTIQNTQWGNLQFVETFPGGGTVVSTVTMSGTVNGITVSGAWNLTSGGSFMDLTGTKQCFDQNLNNIGC